ncbi:MAG TPA: SpoIIE family protein phosphatase [Mycobacteriales bacterium]|nr:SpoIIE family protein phosphatase [Mycobacteriales bacterium]
MVDVPAQAGPSPAYPGDLAAMAALADRIPGAVVGVDLDSSVLLWSRGAERLYGWTVAEALGRSVRELMLHGADERADEVKGATHAGGVWEGAFPAVHKDGRRLVVWVRNAPVVDESGTVVGVVGVSLDLTEHSEALTAREGQLETARRDAELLADRQARLIQVSDALGRALTPEEVVEVVMSQGVAAVEADAGGVALVENGHLRVLGAVGYEPEVAGVYDGLQLAAASPLTDVVRTGKVIRTGTATELDERYPHLAHSALSTSFAGIPLEVENRVLGVMALSAVREHAFPDGDVEFLVTLGRQCAQALERGRLFAASRADAARLEFLARASARLAASLDYRETLEAVVSLAVPEVGDWCSVHLLDEGDRPQLVGLDHRDEELRTLLAELFRRYPPDPGRGAGIGQALGEVRTVHHRTFPEEALRVIARDDWHLAALRRLMLGSALVVPLQAAGRVLGVLTVTREQPDAYSDDDVRLVEELATRMATAVDNAVRYQQQRDTALMLQRSLLPSALPVLPGLASAHRYLPGAAGAEVGGDFYDLLALPGGQVGLVIGDVMGRGVAAAAVMGQLRAAVRAYAMVEDRPSKLLQLVDAAASSLEQGAITTCLYGVLDVERRRLRLASAGHLPLLVVHPDGGGEFVEVDPSPPLGVAGSAPAEVEVDVPDGAVLLLYTDGLVEDRQQPVEEGLLALRNAVAGGPVLDVEALCDEVLRSLGRDGPPDDDIALLAVAVGPTRRAAAGFEVHVHLAGHLSEVGRARRGAAQWAAEQGVDVGEVELLVTELVTNALRHGGPGVDLWLRRRPQGGVRLEVVDGHAATVPVVRAPSPEAEGGRGLVIVQALAERWGTDRLAAGKSVWCELAAR